MGKAPPRHILPAAGNANGTAGNANGAAGDANGAAGNANGAAGKANGAAGNANGAAGDAKSVGFRVALYILELSRLPQHTLLPSGLVCSRTR